MFNFLEKNEREAIRLYTDILTKGFLFSKKLKEMQLYYLGIHILIESNFPNLLNTKRETTQEKMLFRAISTLQRPGFFTEEDIRNSFVTVTLSVGIT